MKIASTYYLPLPLSLAREREYYKTQNTFVSCTAKFPRDSNPTSIRLIWSTKNVLNVSILCMAPIRCNYTLHINVRYICSASYDSMVVAA